MLFQKVKTHADFSQKTSLPSGRTNSGSPDGFHSALESIIGGKLYAGKTMPKRKKRDKTLFPDEITETLPTDLVNLNRAKLTYKHGKTKITLLKSFPAKSLPHLKHIHRLDSVEFTHGGKGALG